MSYGIKFSKRAEEQLEKAVTYYGQEGIELAADLLYAVSNILHLIALNPELYPEKRPPLREAVLKRFPLLLVYQIRSQYILVVSLFDYRQHRDKK